MCVDDLVTHHTIYLVVKAEKQEKQAVWWVRGRVRVVPGGKRINGAKGHGWCKR